ncbi:S1 RNA-binding domain-containing protein [Streptomyces chattanoogensis]|uniref:S1 RNA-binding domain-containing protein n=1 Tax=Streptomyces chattanoogensis TaxID=66876 RepID=UPI0036ADCEAF
MANFVYRITPYDPTPRDLAHCGGTAVPYDTREQVVAACVAAAAGFALDDGADQLVIDNPMPEGFFSFSTRLAWRGHGLAGLFPRDLSGYHDGAHVPLGTGLGLLRAMLLREGAWCRLHTESGFFLHVGERNDIYVGGTRPFAEAAARARRLGLFVESVEHSPYDTALDEADDQPAADGGFWTELHCLVAEHGGALLEERYVANAYRWHRLTSSSQISAVRKGLTPRGRLTVWPDLTEDIEAVRDAVLRSERLALLVEQAPDGSFSQVRVAEPWMGRTDASHLQIKAGPGCRAALIPLEPAERRPLLAGVLPDADGVVRARWRTNRTPADERRALLGSLRDGDVVTGTVASGLDDVGVHVHLDHEWGHGLGFLRVPEMSWEHFDSVDDVAPIGRRIRAEVLHVDWAWERVSLSVKALQPDPWRCFLDTHRAGDVVPGTVVKSVPFGVFVRLAPGVEGLVHVEEGDENPVHLTESAGLGPAGPERTVAVGDAVLVTLLDVDLESRRIRLSLDSRIDGTGPGPT